MRTLSPPAGAILRLVLGYSAVFRLEREAVVDPGLDAALQVVRVPAGCAERLHRHRGADAEGAWEDELAVARQLFRAGGEPLELDVLRARDAARVPLVLLAH